VDNLAGGCYLDAMRLLACALLLLALAVPARALDGDDSGDTDPGDFGKRLRALDEGTERDADYPEAAGEEADEQDPIDADLEPRDPLDDQENADGTESAPRPRRDAPAKAPRYPNVLESAPPSGQATGRKATGKGATPRSPSPLDADD